MCELRGIQKLLEKHDDRESDPQEWNRDRGRGDRSRGRGRGRGNNRDYRPDAARWQRGRSSRGSRGRSSRSNYRAPGPRSRLDNDDDVSMGGDDIDRLKGQKRYNPYGRKPRGGRRGSGGRGRSSYNNRQQYPSSRNQDGDDNMGGSNSSWFKVVIPYGAKQSKSWLLESIKNLCRVPFVPIDYHQENNSSVFHVNDVEASKGLIDVSKRITTPSNHKVIIIVRPSGPPRGSISAPLSESDIQTLTEVMSKRYDPSSKFLDLSDIYNDTDLKAKSIKVLLNQPTPLKAVLDIIAQHIPETVGLNLSSNRIYSLVHFSKLSTMAPNVTNLNLSSNSLKHINELQKIKDLKLKELILDANPLCDSFSDQAKYVRSVRGIFRDVIKLDGHDLSPQIGFDVPTTSLPSVGPSFFPGQEVKTNILQFLQGYYTAFDAQDRSKLIDIYHDQAKFSLSLPFDYGHGSSWYKQLAHHFAQSRNFKKGQDDYKKDKSLKLIKQGRLAVAACLSELPQTQHDLNSFVVDVSLVQPPLVHFTVGGVLQEKERSKTVIAFSRAFIVCAGQTGLVVLNDHLTYRQPSEQQKKAFNNPAPTPTHSPVSAAAPGPSPVVSPVAPAVPDTTVKQQMVQQFIKDSGMNSSFSERCLEENGWDYPTAGAVFTNLKNEGKIPPEAFVQQS
ncbi:putative nuclear RNA export factor 1 [Apostichopus japonicus]|uniref:Putative nuclear RNA export factor 1 n=1 Tax=Stichopus japonicus TaxID=307972 RepID=A0A2G8KP89_STIJA|nr:putative nuclear RNA export factor 1 [Apostichopus japonicus]